VRDLDALARETGFSGVVGAPGFAAAYGLAHRALRVPNTVDTRFAIASGGKGFTALAVMSLIGDGALALSTPVRSLLGDDLPLIGGDVTVEHLLAHRSGIGDYLDEESGGDINDYVLPVPVHELATTSAFLPVLDGYPAKFPPGERFAYCNGGYIVLALIAERVSGVPFHDLVRSRVVAPAGLGDTDFLRSDELPPRTALGYLGASGDRTNVFHLPVLGNGDGGIYSTAADLDAFWGALFAGSIVPPGIVADMVRPRSEAPGESTPFQRYGLGFWLHATGDLVMLEGFDAGVSFRSVHDPDSGRTFTVLSNTSDGAWPVARYLTDRLAT
jgi:CubicO group peptidase (beta-lactamase class C family)